MFPSEKIETYEKALEDICDASRVCPNFTECTHQSCAAVYTMHMLAIEALEKTGARAT